MDALPPPVDGEAPRICAFEIGFPHERGHFRCEAPATAGPWCDYHARLRRQALRPKLSGLRLRH